MIKCDDLKNVQRFWVTSDNCCVREWTQEEYDTLNPTHKFYETFPVLVCRCCGEPLDIFERHQTYCTICKTIKLFCIPWHKQYIEKQMQLHCVEIGEREIDSEHIVKVMNSY